jgi:hypothetical protein
MQRQISRIMPLTTMSYTFKRTCSFFITWIGSPIRKTYENTATVRVMAVGYTIAKAEI